MKTVVKVSIGGLVLLNSELELVEVVQALGEHTTARIDFIRDQATDVRLDTLLGAPVTVDLIEDLGGATRVFQGSISDGQQSHLLNVGSRFSFDVISPSDRHEFLDTVYFPNSTMKSIAEKLGVTIGKPAPSRPDEPFDYVQWGETEFGFLKRLVDRQGGFLVTTGPKVEIRSEFVEKGWELRWADTLLEVTARARPVNHGVTGASYDPAQKHTHAHAGVRVTPATLGGASQLVNAMNELARDAKGGGDPILVEPSGRDSTPSQFKAVLRAESERALGGATVVEGESIVSSLMVGDLINLVSGDNFTLPTTGKLGLVKLTHSFKDQIYTNRFVATPWKAFTSFEAPERSRMSGPVTAEVVDNVDPQKMGRVRVAYRWHTGQDQTNWARLLTPHAGNGRGFMFVPEIGDEVLVDFERGDPERPFVVGSLWNGKDQQPEVTPKNTAKRLITRSGNTIQLLDDENEETIEVFTKDAKCMVQLTNKGGTPVITIKSQGDIALEADKELRIKCQKFTQDVESDSVRKIGGDESVDVSKNATIKAGMDIGLSGGMNAILKGGMNVESVAGAMNNIVGSLVHLQPPGFVGKQVTAKPVVIQEAKLGDRPSPEKAEPQRTADPETPRSN